MREERLKALAIPAVRNRLMAWGLSVNPAQAPPSDEMWKSLVVDCRSVGDTLRAVSDKPE